MSSRGYRKLGKTADQRRALLRQQVTALLYNGKLITTEARAREVAKIAEGMIALAVREKDNFDEVTVSATTKVDEKGNVKAIVLKKCLSVFPADGKQAHIPEC